MGRNPNTINDGEKRPGRAPTAPDPLQDALRVGRSRRRCSVWPFGQPRFRFQPGRSVAAWPGPDHRSFRRSVLSALKWDSSSTSFVGWPWGKHNACERGRHVAGWTAGASSDSTTVFTLLAQNEQSCLVLKAREKIQAMGGALMNYLRLCMKF